jgi:hypothetical protein
MSRHPADPTRRRLLSAAALTSLLPTLGSLGGCASAPLSPIEASERTDPAALAVLQECAAAHGLPAWRRVRDLNVGYRVEWRALVGRIHPELSDTRYRDTAQERLLPAEGLIAQTLIGAGGHKQVVRRLGQQGPSQGDVQVWVDGSPSREAPQRQAAAMVADASRLALLGPLALIDRPGVLKLAGLEQVGDHACERLMVRLTPGLGFAAAEQLVLCIDRRTRLMRRVRFSHAGLASTRGTVTEVDVSGFQNIQGVEWPTRFHERMRKPIPLLPLRDWQLTGLDLNRGWSAEDITGAQFAGVAQAGAKALPGSPAVVR